VIAVGRSEHKLAKARAEGAEVILTASSYTRDDIVEITKGSASVTVDALGSAETTLAALKSLRKYGRHLQLGLTGAQDAGVMPIPTVLLVFNELRLIGSFGCPMTSYAGMFSMVAAGKLQPIRLVETIGSVADASRLLNAMTDYNTLGFSVINEWSPVVS